MDAPTGGQLATAAGAFGTAAGGVVLRWWLQRRKRAGSGATDGDDAPNASGGPGGGFATRAELSAERDERRAGDAANLQHVIDLGESVHDDVVKAVSDAAVAKALAERGGR